MEKYSTNVGLYKYAVKYGMQDSENYGHNYPDMMEAVIRFSNQ